MIIFIFDDGYIFQIGVSNVILFCVQLISEMLLKVKNFFGIFGVGWCIFWLDYCCMSVILGLGNIVILKYNDIDNYQMIYFIKFDKILINQIILFCNR